MSVRRATPLHIIHYSLSIILLLVVALTACNHLPDSPKRFRSLPTQHTKITFKNTITETEDFNILNFHYIYNGGGVGVGDFDRNGLPDLVFSGNQVVSELYLNQGNLQFNNISAAANFTPSGWTTGVSIVDLNQDGWDDIYLSVGGLNCEGNCNNQLFIHQGLNADSIPVFKEMAAEYGLDDGFYTQQAAFFDHDLDGDLDVYLLHNVIDRRDKNAPSQKKFINQKSTDQLLVNNGRNQFSDASEQFGITKRGYGLGITLNDFNQDGHADIYVANDFLSDDLIYVSQLDENGKIEQYLEQSKTYLKHQSYNSMGVDVADLNNDALPEICVLDMLPETHERLKNMQGFMNYDKFLLTLRNDYAPQFVRNVLQVNNGFLNDEQLPFSEVGYQAGMYATDWSWSPLLADFDNDGDRDLFITNGYGKDITDLDFINYSAQL
ncbi:MAG: FG-GAP repeat domain-containing protein, partial [Saprospiraceae bacterium]